MKAKDVRIGDTIDGEIVIEKQVFTGRKGRVTIHFVTRHPIHRLIRILSLPINASVNP